MTVIVGAKGRNVKSGEIDSVDVLSRTGVCRHVRIVAGRCPSAKGDVLLSGRTASALDARVGSLVRFTSDKGAPLPPLRLTGLYLPAGASAPYWWGLDEFSFGTVVYLPPPLLPDHPLDGAFTTQATALQLGSVATPTVFTQLPLIPSSIAATSVPAFLQSVSTYSAGIDVTQAGLVVSTSLPVILGGAAAQEGTMRTIVAVVALQLVLLSLLVLYGVAVRTSEARRPDLAVAELRGIPRRLLAVMALREPFVLLAVASPAGLALGFVTVWLMARRLLFASVPVTIDSLALGAVAVAILGAVVASVVGSRSLFRVRLTQGAGRGRQPGRNRAAIGDAAVVVLAVAALVELAFSGVGAGVATDPLAALAPGLAAVALGVVGSRVLPLACRALARATRWSRHVGTALAVRSIMRRPELARQVALLTIALSLVTFSVASWRIAADNRAVQAAFTVGAAKVLDVQVPIGTNFVQAVRAADPSGKGAMAVVDVTASNGRTLAVDSSRFAAVAAWPPGIAPLDAGAVARVLHPPTPAPVYLRADEARLAVDFVSASLGHPSGSASAAVRPGSATVVRPSLQLNVFDEHYFDEATIDVGVLRPGLHSYTVSLAGACSTSCRFDSIGLLWNPPPRLSTRTVQVSTVFASMAARRTGGPWAPVGAGFSHTHDWRPGPNPGASIGGGSHGLDTTWDLGASQSVPTVERADVPATLPALVTSQMASLNQVVNATSTVPVLGLDGSTLNAGARVQASVVPRAGQDAAIIDLTFAGAIQSGPPAGATDEVWLSPNAGSQVQQRLAAEGIRVTAGQSADSVARGLGRAGTALAFDLFVVAAGAAAILAVGGLLFAIAAAGRRRSIEIEALATTGIPRRMLRRGLIAEYLVVAMTGVLLGIVCGVSSAAFALRSLPEFASGRVGPPFSYPIPAGLLLVVGSAVVIGVAVVVVLATAAVMSSVTADKLRTSSL